MAGLWSRIVPRRNVHSFFEKSILEWVYDNLKDDIEREGSSWGTLFAIAVWWAWKWRCGDIFGCMGQFRDRVRFLKDFAKEVYTAKEAAVGRVNKSLRVVRFIAWKPPCVG